MASIPLVIDYSGDIGAFQFSVEFGDAGLQMPAFIPDPSFPTASPPITPIGNQFNVAIFYPLAVTVSPGDVLGVLQFDLTGLPGDYAVDFLLSPSPPFLSAEVGDENGIPITPLTAAPNGMITVIDRSPIFENCPANITVGTDIGQCDAVANWVEPVLTDCDNNANAPTNNFSPGETFPVGTTTVLYEADDAEGNTGSCTFDIIVEDNEFPTITCANDTSFLILGGSGPVLLSAAFFQPTTADNCSVGGTDYQLTGVTSGSGAYDPAATYSFNVGVTTVTLTVTDGAGNATTCSSTVTVFETSSDVVTMDIGDVFSDCGQDTMVVPVTMAHDFVLSSYQFGIEWDPLLDYVSFEDLLPGSFPPFENQSGSTFSVSRFFITPVSLTAGDTLFLFTYVIPDGAMPGTSYSITLRPDLVTPSVSDDGLVDYELQMLPGSITIDNDDPPSITCPADTIIDCTASTDTSSTGSPIVLDDCTAEPAITFMDVEVTDCGNTLEITRTFVAEDEMMQTSECEQIITVQDTTPPQAVCADDVTVFVDDMGNAMLTPQEVDGGSTDECGGTTATQVTPDAFDCSHIGTGQTVVLSIEDDCGNLDTCQAIITVTDTIPPVPACLDITVEVDAMGDVTIAPADLFDEANSTDNCTDVTADALNMPDLTCDQLGDNELVLTASDEYGNTATCTGTVTVEDNIDPVAGCMDITVELDANGQIIVNPNDVYDPATSSDNCGEVIPTALTNGFLTCDQIGMNTLILTVEDPSENSGTCEAVVTVVDVAPPTAVCLDATIELDPFGVVNLMADEVFDAALSSDNCGMVTADSVSPRNFDCDDIDMPTQATLFVSDGNGNSNTCTAEVTVVDITPPTIACNNLVLDSLGPAGITINANDFVDGISSSDNCTDVDNLVIVQPGATTFTCADVPNSPITITVEVADESGNSSFCESIVEVLDTEAPVAECQDVTLNVPLAGITLLPDQVDNGSTDNCGIDIMIVSPDVFTCDDIMVDNGGIPEQVELTVFDIAGNRDTCVANVTLISTVQPIVECLDITVYVDNFGAASITPEDVFDENESISCGELTPTAVSPMFFDCGDIFAPQSVLLNAVDASGNTGSCTAIVTVLDTIAPNAVCQDVTISLFDESEFIFPELLDGGSSDNCTNPVSYPSVTILEVDCDNIGAPLTTTLTVSDASNNTSTCSATIIVQDASAPDIECPFDVFVQSDVPLAIDSIWPMEVIDNCLSNVDTSYSLTMGGMNVGSGTGDASGTVFDIGTTTVTYTVTDPNGNTATCSFFVTVSPTDPPEIMCPDDLTVYVTSLPCELQVDGIGVTISDPDAVASIDYFLSGATNLAGVDDASGNIFGFGDTDVDYVVTDSFGLSAGCTFTVTVADSAAPVIVCPVNDTFSTDANSCFASVTLIDPEVEECSPFSVTYILSGATVDTGILSAMPVELAPGLTMVTYVVTDTGGLSTTCIYEIMVNDDELPVFACPADLTVATDSASCEAILEGLSSGVSDNCELASVTYSVTGDAVFSDTLDISGEVLPPGVYTVTYRAEDIHGNIDSCSFDLTISDQENPFLSCFAGDTTVTTIAESSIRPLSCREPHQIPYLVRLMRI
jgi:hypothetical protein